MCSSPRIHRHSLVPKSRGTYTSLSFQAMKRFTQCANAADERRTLRQKKLREPVPVAKPAIKTNHSVWHYWLFEFDLYSALKFHH